MKILYVNIRCVSAELKPGLSRVMRESAAQDGAEVIINSKHSHISTITIKFKDNNNSSTITRAKQWLSDHPEYNSTLNTHYAVFKSIN